MRCIHFLHACIIGVNIQPGITVVNLVLVVKKVTCNCDDLTTFFAGVIKQISRSLSECILANWKHSKCDHDGEASQNLEIRL